MFHYMIFCNSTNYTSTTLSKFLYSEKIYFNQSFFITINGIVFERTGLFAHDHLITGYWNNISQSI